MPTYAIKYRGTTTTVGNLEIEANSRLEAILQAEELVKVGDQNEEIGWEQDGFDFEAETVTELL